VALGKMFYHFLFRHELLAAPVTYISILDFALYQYFYLFFKVPLLYHLSRPNICNSSLRGHEDWVKLLTLITAINTEVGLCRSESVDSAPDEILIASSSRLHALFCDFPSCNITPLPEILTALLNEI